MTPRRETLLLWNIGFCSKRLDDAVRGSRIGLLKAMISKHGPSIVALQEAFGIREEGALGSAYEIVESEKGLVTAFLRTRWEVSASVRFVQDRALLATVDSDDRKMRLRSWNVHLPGYRTTDERRRNYVQKLRIALDDISIKAPDRSDLMVGDFNLQPYDVAMTTPTALNANRSYPWVAKRSTPRHGMGRPLFNPTWALFGRVKPPYGTFYKAIDEGGGPWFIWDQALMSADLALLGEPQVSLIHHVGDTDLCACSKERAPRQGVGSDHLPLLVEFRAT